LYPESNFECRIPDYLSRAQKMGVSVTGFLDPAQQQLLRGKSKTLTFAVWGGYEDAERAMAVLSQNILSVKELTESTEIRTVKITWEAADAGLTHRDFLGAVLSLGIKRETIGDIIITCGSAFLFTTIPMAAYITEELHEVKNCTVTCRVTQAENLPVLKQETEQSRIGVASLRADCIIAAVLRQSRQETLNLVLSGAVKINHIPIKKADTVLKPGDLISIRGVGRFLLGEINGKSRKDRIYINIKKIL